jgi:photosystem II stability/assembly factor-like uncharacterized protein
MKAKSIFQSLFNRSVLTVFAAVAVPFTQNSVFAERDLAGSNGLEPQSTNTLQEWLETQPWWWMLKERSSPSAVPLDGPTLSQRYAEAVAQMEQLQAAKFEPEPQPPSTWANIGPAHIASNGCDYAAENSGRIVSVAVDPADASHWLITADSGGIWETVDAGGTWIPRTDDQSTLQLSSESAAIAFAPSIGIVNPRVVYASAFAGLLKSNDGGTTWTLVEKAIFGGRGARRFVVSPSDPNVVVAAVDTLFGSDASYGIYRTTDGGFTWAQELSHSASDLVSVVGDFTKQYAAIGELGYASNGVYRSTDSGQNWQRIAGPWDSHADRISLALAPSDSSVLYVAVEDNTNFSHVLGVWKSSNAWDPTPTWTQLSAPAKYNISFGRPFSVDPANSGDLYAGGTYLFKYHDGQWTTIWRCPPNGTHVDFWGLQWIGGDFVVTNDGGIFRSSDKGATYQSRNDDLPIAQFYPGAAIHPTNPNLALGGTQDNATPIYGGSRIWQQLSATGDGMSNAISVVNPDTQWIASGYDMRIYRTRDGGASWNRIDQGIWANCRQFITRLVGCSAADVVITGTCTHIWRSDDAFSADQPTWNVNSPNLGEDPQAMAFAPSDTTCSTYAIGAPLGKVWATTNAGATWSQIGPVNQLPTRVVTCLAFDPGDARKLYATLSGFNADGGHPGHVYMCSDITSFNPTWADISPALDSPHDAIAVDPQIPNHLYAGTDVGMVISTDSGTTWAAVPSNQIPRVIVNDIKINRTTNLVVAFTYGRGAYSGTLPSAAGLIGSTPSHRELPYVADRRYRVSPLRRPWWLGLGILGTLVITRSYVGRSRKRARKSGGHDRPPAKAD